MNNVLPPSLLRIIRISSHILIHPFLVQCGEHNFKRREICFKCQSPRCESELVNDVQKEVSVYPTSSKSLYNSCDNRIVINFFI